MTIINNPFVTSGYVSADYFCDHLDPPYGENRID